MQSLTASSPGLALKDGSRVGVIGSGPAGSFFTYFLLENAERIGLELEVDIFEYRDFGAVAPKGCNMCGGIISESLVQLLATEGINLPASVIQRGIDSYVLHMDVGTVRIDTPLHEMRIGAVHRGAGPRDVKQLKYGSFDGYLQGLAVERGATVVPGRVDTVEFDHGRPRVAVRGGEPRTYDLLTVAVGVNSATLKLFEQQDLGYRAPQASKTYIREYFMGEEIIEKVLGNSMHVFLLNIPRLEFAAVIPKGDYATVCLLGEEIDNALVEEFMNAPEVKACLPPDFHAEQRSCQCAPKISVEGAVQPYADRLLFIGDSGITRLYKDGIGAAYRTAKAAATAAVFQGISADAFREHYWPTCAGIRSDNRIGKLTFAITGLVQKYRFARRALLRMVSREQAQEGQQRRMSMVLWDVFTGSAPYRDIFRRTLNPAFIGRFLWDLTTSLFPSRAESS